MKKLLAALLLLPSLALGQTYPSPTFQSLTLGGASGSTATGFGTAIGQVPLWINYQGSGLSGLLASSRLVFARATPAATDFADFQFQRTTSYSTSAGAQTSIVEIDGTYGTNDGGHNWTTLIKSTTASTAASGLTVNLFSQANRAVGGTNAIWSGILETRDYSLLASSATGMKQQVTMELDLRANKEDDGVNGSAFGGIGIRRGIHLVFGRNDTSDATQATFGTLIWIAQSTPADTVESSANAKSVIGFAVNTQIIQALDTRGAVVPSSYTDPLAAVRMSAGHIIDFNGGAALTSNGGNYLKYDSGSSRLKYFVGSTAVLSIDASGNVRALGTVTGSTTP